MDKGYKNFARNNVITTEEACCILGRSRQQVNNMIRAGKIQVFKCTSNGNLFWRPDIYRLSKKINHEKARENKEIHGFTTAESIEEFERLNIDPKIVEQVFVFFGHRDAILKDFYNVYETEITNTLTPIKGARFVIVTKNNEEYWFDGLTCGYVGQGANGSLQVLSKLGITIKNVLLSDIVYKNEWLYFYREGDEWIYEGGNSVFDKNDYISEKNLLGVDEKIFRFNGHLVLTQAARYREVFGEVNEPSKEILLKSLYFVPDPVSIEFISSDDALSTGHYTSYYGETILFQVVIRDVSDRELWLQYPFSDISIEKQINMKELMRMLGVEFETVENTLPERLAKWLKRKPRSIYRNYSISKERD